MEAAIPTLHRCAVAQLDEDMPQYIHDNTDDEFTHQNFLNAYLVSKGAAPVNLERFRTLPGSKATGSSGKLRLTNLMQLTLDTSWYTRYRSSDHNPDLEPNFVFPQAVPDSGRGTASGDSADRRRHDRSEFPTGDRQHCSDSICRRSNKAETACIPQWRNVRRSVEVLRILISIGPTETMHFQTWSDNAGNAPPLTAKDPVTGRVSDFPGSESASVWRGDVSDQPDHAGAMSFHQPKAAAYAL